MTDAGRFERGEQYSAGHGVVTHRGVDPITGLDVLIYDFRGAPTMPAGPAVSDHVLKVLSAERYSVDDEERGRLVAAFPSGASLVAPGESTVDDRFVLQALQGLRDPQAGGLVHGDLSPSRLLYSLGEVAIEGYGVPWRPLPPGEDAKRAAARADVVAMAKSLLALAGSDLSTEVAAALRAAASDAANPPMSAERLYGIVKRLAGGAVKVPASGFIDLTLPTVPTRSAPQEAQQGTTRESRPAAAPETPQSARRAEPAREAKPERQRPAPPTQPRRSTAPARPTPIDPEPITLVSDPGLTVAKPPSPKDSSPGFVKDLPPGAKYRHGNLDEGPRPAPIRVDRQESFGRPKRRAWRGPALLLLMLLVAGLAGYLALLDQNSEDNGFTGPFESYLVSVSVLPANLPPVQLVVDQSPSGSSNRPGTVMAAVPRAVTFDAAGTWVVHGRFQGRETPPVTLQVPQDTSITLEFPAAEQ